VSAARRRPHPTPGFAGPRGRRPSATGRGSE
jgi:hypothetical protein